MKTSLILAIATAICFSSCATYRSGSTPDDVYYSPERERFAYEENWNDERYTSREDLRLRQQIRDSRFRTLNDDFFWNDRQLNWHHGNSWFNRPLWGNAWYNQAGIWGSPFYSSNQPFFIIPGTNFVISSPGKGSSFTTKPRYTPIISSIPRNQGNTNTGYNGKFNTGSSNNGSRFFGGATNQSGNTYRYYTPSSGSGSFWNGSSGGSGSRTFGSGSSSSGRSNSGSSGTRSRRN